MCVCVCYKHLYVQVCTLTHVHVEARGELWGFSSVVLHLMPLLDLSGWTQSSTFWPGQLATELLGFACLCPLVLGLQVYTVDPGFYVGSGDLKLRSYCFHSKSHTYWPISLVLV